MKVRYALGPIAVVLFCLIAVIGGGVTWWVFAAQARDCEAGSTETAGVIRAAKVVAKPWMGPHHVYGVFIVPVKYGDTAKYRATVSMPTGNFVVEAGGERGNWHDLLIPPGYFPKQVYVPTRRVLWSLMRGRLARIGDPCNWTIQFLERIS